jgi:hypothetical protein
VRRNLTFHPDEDSAATLREKPAPIKARHQHDHDATCQMVAATGAVQSPALFAPDSGELHGKTDRLQAAHFELQLEGGTRFTRELLATALTLSRPEEESLWLATIANLLDAMLAACAAPSANGGTLARCVTRSRFRERHSVPPA